MFLNLKLRRKYLKYKKLWNNGYFSYKNNNVKNFQRDINNEEVKTFIISRVIKLFNIKPYLFKSIKYYNVRRSKRNIFINLATLNGNILKQASSGMIHKKGSDRRTYVAFTELLEYTSPTKLKDFMFSRYIIRVKAKNHTRTGFKKNLKENLVKTEEFKKQKVYKFISIKFKAHNGVRKRKQKRK